MNDKDFAPSTHPDGDKLGCVGHPSCHAIYLVLTLHVAVCFKDLKTKCIKAAKEVPEKPTGGKNKGKCTLTKAVVATLGF